MRVFYLIITVILCSHAQNALAQSWNWAETAGGTLPDEANGCFQDQNGNMYLSGFYFSTDINFGNGNQMNNDGLSDGFIVKYDVNGSTQWSSKVKGPAEDKATKCTADRFGNVFTTGYFDSQSIQFGGNNNHSVSNSGSSGTFDAFIVKYNSSGTPQWFHSIGEEDDDGGSSLATDTAGNVFVTGWFRAASVELSSSTTIYNTGQTTGPSDMFLIKYSAGGDVLWAKAAGGPDDEKGRGVTVDPDGNVIVTGYTKPTSMTIEGTVYPNNGSKDFFVIKYDPNGNLLAAKTFGGSGSEEAFACSADGFGNIYVAGNYSSSSVTFDTVTMTNPGSGSGAFLLKLDPNLNALWARGFSSDSNDEALGCYSDSYGNAVVTGTFSGNSLTIGNTSLNNNGGDEIFVAKYNPNGDLFWATKIGKSDDDGATDCHIADNGRVLISGYYNSGSLTLGNIDLDNSYVFINTSDLFIANMCNAQEGTHTVNACSEYTWIDGNTYTSNNNTAVWSFPNSGNSCDSIVTLNLTVNPVDVSVSEVAQTLTANAAPATYRWLDCDDNYAVLPTETGQSFTANTNGNYAVEVTENACVDTSDCFAVNNVPVGLNELVEQKSLLIFPNPASSVISIQFPEPTLKTVRTSLYDMKGRLVHQQPFNPNMDVGYLDRGTYIVVVETEEGDFRGMVQKE